MKKVKCGKCSTEMTRARATSYVGKFSAMKEPVKMFSKGQNSPLIPFVCSSCGFVEWHVENPEVFK